jgi:hypothetical protein
LSSTVSHPRSRRYGTPMRLSAGRRSRD